MNYKKLKGVALSLCARRYTGNWPSLKKKKEA